MAHKNTVAMETSSSSPYLAVARNGATDLATSLATQQAHDMVGGVVVKTERQLRRERRRRKRWTVVVAIVCLSAFFVGLAAMIVHATLVAYLAFVFPLFTGPYAIRQRRKLNKLPTLVNVLNQIRETANVLLFENDKLHAENNRLAHQVSRLNQAETKLSALAEKSGSNVAAICDLVKENAAAMKQMKQLLCAKELQTLLTALLQSDKNGDHNLSPQELEVLLLRCQSFSVTDEIKLRDALMQASAGANVSTTSLYNAAVASSFADDDEVKDFTLGYGNWLFDEEAVDAA